MNRNEALSDASIFQVGIGYDAANRPTRLTPPSRPDHGFGYDRIGQTGVTRPDGATVALTYEPASGLLQTRTTPTGPYAYGFVRGLLAEVAAPGDLRIERSYDGPLPTCEETFDAAFGARRSLVLMGYDDYARLGTLAVSSHAASTAVAMGYGYDDDGLLTSATRVADPRPRRRQRPADRHRGRRCHIVRGKRRDQARTALHAAFPSRRSWRTVHVLKLSACTTRPSCWRSAGRGSLPCGGSGLWDRGSR
jgi:hypothetical protein